MDRVRAAAAAAVVFAFAIPLGFLGAWAFNPDNGAVLHNEVLWRIFGIMFEGGLMLVFALVILLLVLSAAGKVLRSLSG